MKVQEKREDNELDETEQGKIISLNKTEVLSNIEKLESIDDKLLYGLYTLTPSRRLDYRTMIITNETDISKLNELNYLVLNKEGMKNKKFVFNDYKTSKTYGKQVFTIPTELDNIIDTYLKTKGLSSGDKFIPLNRNKNEMLDEGNFSNRIKNVFHKVYGIPISLRYIRMSWSSDLYSKIPNVKEIKQLSFMMWDSPNESRLYNKLFKET
jgi:hypothetical protein